MKLNRTKAPPNRIIDHISLRNPQLINLDNGIRCYLVDGGLQDVCKIDFIFDAGAYNQCQPLIARFTNLLMPEGSAAHNAFEIASIIEYYGAYLNSFTQKDTAGFSMSVLNSKLPLVLPVLEEILKYPVFPEYELQLLVSKEKKNFLDDSQKVNVVAAQEFNELVFGSDHPYGRKAGIKDFDNVHQGLLKDFFGSYYHAGNGFIIVSGKLHPDIEGLLNRYFGSKNWLSVETDKEAGDKPFAPGVAQKAFSEMPGVVQNAIRIGKRTISMTHNDHAELSVVNTILGGYFGSRLMANIREDKGYTYGIFSALVSYKHTGIFYISTDVGAEVCHAAITEIYKEVDRLCSELVSENELELVKNYMLGNLLRSIDGPFSTAAYIKSLIEFGIDMNDFTANLFKTIKQISADNVLTAAQKYLQVSSLSEQTAGKK